MQIIVNGFISGSTIAVLALAFSVVYLSTRVFHVALGAVYAAVPFIVWVCLEWGWPWYLALAVAILTGVGLSLACELINHAPLERKGAASGAHLVSSLGIYIILVQVIALIWGNEIKVLRTGIGARVTFGEVVLTHAQLTAALVSACLLVLFFVSLRFSKVGLQLRALADNPTEFALRGYNVNRFRLLAFGLSAVLGSASSVLVAHDVGFDPHSGLTAVLLAIVAAIIGGKQSFIGPVIGGLLIGLVRSEVVWFLSARWQDVVTFLLLALFLYIRPQGIVGQRIRLEVAE